MIKKLTDKGKKKPRVAVSQFLIDETDIAGMEMRRGEAESRARCEGAEYLALGGTSEKFEDERIIIVTDATLYHGREAIAIEECAQMAKASGKPVVLAGASGVSDGGKVIRVYDGTSGIFMPDGGFKRLIPRFEEGFRVIDLATDDTADGEIEAEGIEAKAQALRFGLRNFMKRLGIERVAIGISGGIDSAVASALYASLLAPENLLLVAMPGPYTSQTTRHLAKELAKNLGSRFAEIPIGEAVDLTCRQFAELRSEGPGGGIQGAWELSPFAVENVQARDRGSRVLAAAAAAFGGVASCNANKAESTIGYGTLHGDIFGWLSCIGDLWKGEVYALGRYLNDKVFGREVIPEGIFKIKPSAELSEAQAVDRGLGDPLDYPYHDALFRSWVEGGRTLDDSVAAYKSGTLARTIGYAGDIETHFPTLEAFESDARRWWRLFRGLAVAKRLQAPPVLGVSPRAFGEFKEVQCNAVRCTALHS